MIRLLAVIGYDPTGCFFTACPSFGECGVEDKLILAAEKGQLADPAVRDNLRQQGYPVHKFVASVPPRLEDILEGLGIPVPAVRDTLPEAA